MAGALTAEIARAHAVHDLPVVLGEFGFNTQQPVDDATQQAVLRAIVGQLGQIPYLRGGNYWVLSGDAGVGSRLFDPTRIDREARPAAQELADFYRSRADRCSPAGTLIASSSPSFCGTHASRPVLLAPPGRRADWYHPTPSIGSHRG